MRTPRRRATSSRRPRWCCLLLHCLLLAAYCLLFKPTAYYLLRLGDQGGTAHLGRRHPLGELAHRARAVRRGARSGRAACAWRAAVRAADRPAPGARRRGGGARRDGRRAARRAGGLAPPRGARARFYPPAARGARRGGRARAGVTRRAIAPRRAAGDRWGLSRLDSHPRPSPLWHSCFARA